MAFVVSNNFYDYSCGSWVTNATIPADSGGIAMKWDEAEDEAYAQLKEMFEKKYAKGSQFEKVHDWYRSCMDHERANELGGSPLLPWLAQVLIY